MRFIAISETTRKYAMIFYTFDNKTYGLIDLSYLTLICVKRDVTDIYKLLLDSSNALTIDKTINDLEIMQNMLILFDTESFNSLHEFIIYYDVISNI